MTDLVVFHFDNDRPSFEDLGVPNGTRTWPEAALMKALGYAERKTFRNAVTRAMQACLSLGISTEENFIHANGEYKFTRFACYLIAMNGDPKKPEVAAAQGYFVAIAETFQSEIEHAEGIDRILVREELTGGFKSLDSTAKRHGVDNYAFFVNQGYRGMYNMDLARLERFKGIDAKEKLLDRMGKVELAANLFRVTQTDAKIKNDNIHGQRRLEETAFDVGRTVRNTMMQISGTTPEHLPIAAPIKEVKATLESTNKKFKELDGKKITKKRKPSASTLQSALPGIDGKRKSDR